MFLFTAYDPSHDKTNKLTCAPSFAVRMKKAWVFRYQLSADAQADLSLRWAHRPFYWFCDEAVHIWSRVLFCLTYRPSYLFSVCLYTGKFEEKYFFVYGIYARLFSCLWHTRTHPPAGPKTL